LVKLVGLVGLINPTNWFSISKLKLFMRLALTKVCVLAPNDSFCCRSLIASSHY
jgi:hypothetical protein